MKKHEASFQTVFNHYLRTLRQSGRPFFGNFELKQTGTDSLAFDAVKNHQKAGLLAAEKAGFIWKYSDEDSREKPFDCSSIPPLPGYVAVLYRLSGFFYVIPHHRFVEESIDSERRSLTEERAGKICIQRVRI